MALDLNNILVYNFNHSVLCVDSAKEHYTFGASDGVDPTINIMPLADLQYINSNTMIIKNGWLTFEDEYKQEIYEKLRIPNWESIMMDKDIEDIILNPTIDGLNKLISIENSSYFDRVRLVLLKLLEKDIDVTTKVKDVIDRRYKELLQKKRKSEIKITEKATKVPSDKTKELEDKNASLQLQLDEMRAMMEQLMSMQTTNNESEEKVDAKTTQTKKPVGRPRTKK